MLTLLHSEWPKPYGVLTVLSAIGLTKYFSFNALYLKTYFSESVAAEKTVRFCCKLFKFSSRKLLRLSGPKVILFHSHNMLNFSL